MAVAEIQPTPEDKGSPLNSEIREMVREEGYIDNAVIAKRLLMEGSQFFLRLTPEDQYRMVVSYIQNIVRVERNKSIRTERFASEGSPVVNMLRISPVGMHYYSSVWHVAGIAKQTRELSRKDLEVLVKQEYASMREAKARVIWLLEVLKFARKHKAEVLGDLEKKGLQLPSIETPDED